MLADPRANMKPTDDPRDLLVNGILAEVTRLFAPDWNVFDKVLIVGAQATDQFGGGSFQVPVGDSKKNLPVAVVDVLSPFSNVCQELGHTFALDHEMDTGIDDYMSPYSVMSSEGYGSARSSFERPVDNRLPAGKPTLQDVSFVVTPDVQRIIGPYITPVQFSVKAMGTFNDPQTVYHVPDSMATQPHAFRLTAVFPRTSAQPQLRLGAFDRWIAGSAGGDRHPRAQSEHQACHVRGPDSACKYEW